MNERKAIIEISKIKEDLDLYPRNKWDWQTSYIYSQAMKSGSKFPPLIVGEWEGELYLIDGKHRIEALKTLKEKFCATIIMSGFVKKEDIYKEAVIRNSKHGKGFSVYDRRIICIKLKEFGMQDVSISKLMGVPMTKLEEFTSQNLSYDRTTGKPVVLKSPMKHFEGQEVISEDIEHAQESLATRGQSQLISQVISILECDGFDLKDEVIFTKLVRLKKLLVINKKIKMVRGRKKK